MRIIAPGKKEANDWWHGHSVVCPACGQAVILEPDDAKAYNVNIGPGSVHICCSCCQTGHAIYK